MSSLLTELPASAAMSEGFFLFAWNSTFLTALAGSLCNLYLLFKFMTRTTKTTGFQKMCSVKSVANSIICCSFLFWVVPVTAMSLKFSQLNNSVNRKIGLISCTWSYFLNSLIQVCMSCNRFYVLYFPFGIKRLGGIPLTQWVIVICVVSITAFSAGALPEGCGFVFDSNLFLWRDESQECAGKIAVFIPYLVSTTTFLTHCFNVATVLRLLVQKQVGLREDEARKRRRRWMIMFTQSVIQDCLQLWDIANSYYIIWMRPDIWWRFLFGNYSLILVITLDGLVMFICHSDVHPHWVKRCCQAKRGAVIEIAPKASSSANQ